MTIISHALIPAIALSSQRDHLNTPCHHLGSDYAAQPDLRPRQPPKRNDTCDRVCHKVAHLHSREAENVLTSSGLWMQGEVWPNRCSEAIDEANSRIADLCEGSPHLHYIDLGAVRPHHVL